MADLEGRVARLERQLLVWRVVAAASLAIGAAGLTVAACRWRSALLRPSLEARVAVGDGAGAMAAGGMPVAPPRRPAGGVSADLKDPFTEAAPGAAGPGTMPTAPATGREDVRDPFAGAPAVRVPATVPPSSGDLRDPFAAPAAPARHVPADIEDPWAEPRRDAGTRHGGTQTTPPH